MPQVLAATLPIGALSNQVGTVVKLVRVLMLGPVVLGISLVAGSRSGGTRLGFGQMVPWFIAGFLVVAALRATGWIPADVLDGTKIVAGLLTTVAMAALGSVPIAPVTARLIQASSEGLDHGGVVLVERNAVGGDRAAVAPPGRQASGGRSQGAERHPASFSRRPALACAA